MAKLEATWNNTQTLTGEPYRCGYCETHVPRYKGYSAKGGNATISICHNCNLPTYFDPQGLQVPQPPLGGRVEGLPDSVGLACQEAREALGVRAPTAAGMMLRKLLMNVAVARGGEVDRGFQYYADYLAEQNLVPPDCQEWVQRVRDKGNEANHEIPQLEQAEAEDLLEFTEMLLRFMYEFPHRMSGKEGRRA